jgi:hypothetical protein
MDAETRKMREEFLNWLKQAEKLGDGVHDIKIEQILSIGQASISLPEVVLIRDDLDRILVIPEDKGKVEPSSLVDRWDLTEGMHLRLYVKGEETLRVFKIGV